MGPPSSPVPAPPPASADAAAVRAYATTLKDLGNDRFAAGDDDSASALYGKALDACHGSMGDLRCAALCNRAACHLRAKRWRACVADCDAALALDGAGQGALPASARGRGPRDPRPRPGTTRRFSSSSLGTRTRRSARARPAPAPGDLAEDFDAFSVRVRLAVSSLEDVGVALVGPSGRASAGWFEPDGDYAPWRRRRPPVASGWAQTRASRTPRRPPQALPRRRRAAARGRRAPARRLAARRGARRGGVRRAAAAAAAAALGGSAPRRAALLGWLDGCGATCVVDRSCKVELPLPRAAPAPPATAPALGERRAAVDARGAVLVLPGFVDAAEAARIVAAASERGAMGPAREERGGGAPPPRARTNTCGRRRARACPGLVATALALFPGCAPDRVEVQVVRYGAGERYDNHHARRVAARRRCGSGRATSAWHAPAGARRRAPDLGPCDRASSPAGPLAPGVDIAARPGDGLLWHNVDEWGRRDERVEHARARAPDPAAGAARGARRRGAGRRGAHRGAAEPRTPQAGRAVGAGVKWGVNVWLGAAKG
ncbi:hypothetical protein SO694_00156016 [Aureococcus anophagefferens]|uniref:Prolyl 4-hydroxylase alpha subunit domain-containing protein n=1 Tax=Aureococcus anophagefferens TaxID=44056 RepID=A0ABR1G143_AURAN